MMLTTGEGLVTVIVSAHDALLPDESLATQLIVVAPTGYRSVKARPSLRVPTTDRIPQLSVAVGRLGFKLAPHDPGTLSTTLTLTGHVIVGGVLSLTVKVVMQVLELLAASVAVTVIVVVPKPTSVPAAGFCDKVTGPQLSEAETPLSTFGTRA